MLMTHVLDLQFGDRIVTLMAALVLVLQIAMVAQRWIVGVHDRELPRRIVRRHRVSCSR